MAAFVEALAVAVLAGVLGVVSASAFDVFDDALAGLPGYPGVADCVEARLAETGFDPAEAALALTDGVEVPGVVECAASVVGDPGDPGGLPEWLVEALESPAAPG